MLTWCFLVLRGPVFNHSSAFEAMKKLIREAAIVSNAQHGLRLDQAAAELFPGYSRSRLQQWIRGGQMLVDDSALRPRILHRELLAMMICPLSLNSQKKSLHKFACKQRGPQVFREIPLLKGPGCQLVSRMAQSRSLTEERRLHSSEPARPN